MLTLSLLRRRPLLPRLLHPFRRRTLSTTTIGGLSLTVAILAGSTFHGFAKELTNVFTPFSLLFMSELLTALIALFSFGFFPLLQEMLRLDRKKIRSMFAIAVLNGIVAPFLLFTGLTQTSAINAGFFSRMEIVFLLVLSRCFLRERITTVHAAATGAILTGILLISSQGLTQSLAVLPGDALVVASMFCYALGHTMFRTSLSHTSTHLVVFTRSLSAIAFFLLVAPFLHDPVFYDIRLLPFELISTLIGFALIARFLHTLAFYEAAERLPMGVVSILLSLTVIGSALFAFVYLGESLHWYHMGGALFIVLGAMLLELLHTHRNEDLAEARLKQKVL